MSLQQMGSAVGLGRDQQIFNRLFRVGQEHLLRFWNELSKPQQRRLADQLDAVDLELVGSLVRGENLQADSALLAERAAPPPAIRPGSSDLPFTREQARACGEAALHAGKVGMILVAGGEGTRLGFAAPKGLLPLGPVSRRSLFQILIDRMTAVSRRFAARIPLYVMTSPATHAATVAFLEEHQRFGAAAEDVHLFRQGVMPAVCAETGRVLMSARDELCLAPDGHGGMLEALAASGGLQEAVLRGVEHFFYCQVDNPLAPCCDPELIGWSILTGSEMTTLAVAKTHAQERMGNIVAVDSVLRILEYSELPLEAASRRNPDGSLHLWAGNTAIHVMATEFLRRVAASPTLLPYHRARKATPYLDSHGNLITPTAPNAIKFERFIFDLLPAAQRAIVVEAPRRHVFAPVKDAPGQGENTPESAQRAMIDLHRRWLREAGAWVAEDVPVEIHPRYALDAEELAARLPRETAVHTPTYFQEPLP